MNGGAGPGRLHSVRCASCGWTLESVDPGGCGGEWLTLDASIGEDVVSHMRNCPARFYGAPPFTMLPRWQRTDRYDAHGVLDHLEIAWTTAAWGLPLSLDGAA